MQLTLCSLHLHLVDIMSNLDIDALCRYLISRKLYLQVTNELLERSPIVQYEQTENDSVDGELIPGKKRWKCSALFTPILR